MTKATYTIYEDSNLYHERDEVPDTCCSTQEEVGAIAHEKFPGRTDEDFRKDMTKVLRRLTSPMKTPTATKWLSSHSLDQTVSTTFFNYLVLLTASQREVVVARLISHVFADAKAAEEWRNDSQNKDKEEWCRTPEEHRAWLHDNSYDTGQYDDSEDRDEDEDDDDDDDDDTIDDTTHKRQSQHRTQPPPTSPSMTPPGTLPTTLPTISP